jgi:hypothetical protein
MSHEDLGSQNFVRPLHKRERIDVVANTLGRHAGTFNDPELRLWITDHIVEIDAAAPGRWRAIMTMLTDWYAKPELGHLIIIAGTRLIQGHVVIPAEFQEWVQWRRENHGWMDDAWILPLETILEEHR